nr:hypothetical protein [Tanacetum cinerariifolium]
MCNDGGEVKDSVNTTIHLTTLTTYLATRTIIPTITLITRTTSCPTPVLPARPPVPPPRYAVAGRPKLQIVIVDGIIYTRENMGNARLEDLSRSGPNKWYQSLERNGNIKKSLGRDSKGGIIILSPVSFEEHVAVQRETKARTLLLQSLPKDHMADFHHLDDAREIWLAVKARFGGNEESKKMRKTMLKQEFSEFSVSKDEGLHKGYDRFQKILSQLTQMQAKPDNDDVNIKFLRALPPSWSQVALTLKTRGGLEYLSFDDLYNKLRSFEIDVKGGSSYGSRSTTIAPTHSTFIGAASTTTKMLDQLEMEELDIKWQMAMLSLRINKFQKKAGRKINFNNKDSARFDRRKARCYNCLQLGHFSRECNVKKNEHEAENKTKEGEQVYGLMAGFESDFADHAGNAAGSVYNAAAEFAMMGISPKENVKPPRNLCNKSGKADRIHSSTSVSRSIPAASSNRPASIHASRHILAGRFNKPAHFPAGRSVPTDGVLLLGPQQVHPYVNKDIGGTVTFGSGDGKITGKGTIRTFKLNFENVYYVEGLQNFNLFYVSQICYKKNKVLFTDDECLVLTKEFQLPDESQVVLRIPRRHNLYTFNLSDIQPEQHINCLLAKGSLEESTKWQRRMAHVNFKTINKLAKNGLVEGLPLKLFTNEHNCVACNKGKQHKASYKAICVVRTISQPLQLLHMDLFGPTSIRKAVSTACYVLNRVSITNPHNKTPYELLFRKVPNIHHLKPFGCQVTILNTSDHLGKCKGKAHEGFLVGYAANSKAYRVYNLSNKKVEETLNLRYLEDKPNVQGLGQELYFNLDYLTNSLGYTHFKTNTPVAEMLHQAKIKTRRNLVLAVGDPAGSIFSTGGVPAGSVPAGSVPASSVPASSVLASHVPASSVSARNVHASNVLAGGVLTGSIDSVGFGHSAASEFVLVIFTPNHAANSTLPPGHSLGLSEHSTRFPSLLDLGNHQPTAGIFSSSSYEDDFCVDVTNLALSVVVDPVATKRVNTIHPQSHIIRELQSPVQTRKPSSVEKALEDSDWVAAMQEEMQQFYNQQNKRDARGIMVRNKARLVGQGHRQEEGIDYDEVFTLVARIEAIRLFLAFASYMGFMVYQMDVKSAFLYEEIKEEVHVTQPKGFEYPHNPKHVYKVVKALYRLHQAPRAWYARLSTFLLKHHYRRVWCDEFEVLMKGEFEMSVMGELTFFLGLQVKQLPDGIFISQDKSMIGSLMYLTASRPDIMFAVSACSRHQVTPITSHLNAVKKIFKYIKGQPNLGLWYPRDSPFQLKAYSDSDYAGSHGDRKSTTSGCQFLGKRLISWQCKKQTIVATSSTKAEYVATASCCGQVLWIQNQMLDYGFNFMNTKIFIDNHSTICIVKTPVFHQRTKHIEIRHQFIRDANEKNLIHVLKIHTDENVADLLTKAFDGPRFYYLVYVYILTHSCRFYLVYYRMTVVSCGFLLYVVQIVGRPPMLLVVPVFLLVVLVHVDRWKSAGSCTIPTGSCTILTGSCTIPTGSYSFMLLDWFLLATTSVRTLEAGPSEIIATIDGNEVVVTESLIRTQLQLNDANGLYEFTLHDVLDGMQEIGYPTDGSLTFYKAKLSPQWRFFIHTLIYCMSPKFGGGISSLTTDPSPRPTFDFTAKLFSNMKLNWDGPHMPLLAPMLVVPAGGDGADAAVAGAVAVNEVSPPLPPPDVPPTHTSSSTSGPSPAAQDTPEPTPDSSRPPSPPPYPRSEEVSPTTLTRPPSPTRQTSFQEDISEGGSDYVSLPKSNEALPTTAATAGGGAGDSAALTDLSLKHDRCINRVTTLENELGVTKKVLGGAVLMLVSRVKRLEGLLQQRKRRLMLSDSKGDEAATKEQDIDLDALHKLASTSLGGDTTVEAAYTIYKASQDAHASSNAGHDEDEVPNDTTMSFRRTRTKRRRLRKTVTSSAFEHFQENISAVEDTIPAGDGIPANAQTIPAGSTPIPSSGGVSAGSSMDPAGQAATGAPSSTILAANKGKAPMIDDSLPADLLTEQERILKNLHDYQLREDLAKKLHAEQEAEFARQQEELAQKAQVEGVASPTEQGTGLSAQCHRELDAAQLIYTKADWLELMAKITTNSALSKQLLGDDVNEENMNERLGMLLMRNRRELAEQSRVKPMNKTQQRDFMRDFMKNQSASVYNQGWTMKQVKALIISQLKHKFAYIHRTLERSNLLNFKRTTFRPTPTLKAPSAKRARQEVPQDVHAASSQVPASVFAAPSTAAAVSVPAAPSIAADVLVFAAPSVHADTEVDADEYHLDDTQTTSEQVSTEHVSTEHTVDESTPSSLCSRRFIHDYYDMEEHIKHFTSLRELLHMVEKNDLRKLLGRLAYSQLAFISSYSGSCVLETVDGRVIYMFFDVSYPLSEATLKRMLKHGLEVPKLLVGGDLTMAEHLVSFIKAALLNAQSGV